MLGSESLYLSRQSGIMSKTAVNAGAVVFPPPLHAEAVESPCLFQAPLPSPLMPLDSVTAVQRMARARGLCVFQRSGSACVHM